MTPLAVETFISSGFDGMPKNAVFPHVLPLKEGQWLGAESNRRHVDFQSTALPTELPSRDRRRVLVASWDFHYAAMWLQGKRSAFRWPTRRCACRTRFCELTDTLLA